MLPANSSTGCGKGDTVWIVTCRDRHPRLIGRILVAEVATQRLAETVLGSNDIWRASFHILAEPGTELPIAELEANEVAANLRFVSERGRDRLSVNNGEVNAQQLQAMRRLTPESADRLTE